jgi:hypothetical protein
MLKMQAQIDTLNQKWHMTDAYIKAKSDIVVNTRTISLHTESVPSLDLRDETSKKDNKSSARLSPKQAKLMLNSNAFMMMSQEKPVFSPLTYHLKPVD